MNRNLNSMSYSHTAAVFVFSRPCLNMGFWQIKKLQCENYLKCQKMIKETIPIQNGSSFI